jgi:hypothetical protein
METMEFNDQEIRMIREINLEYNEKIIEYKNKRKEIFEYVELYKRLTFNDERYESVKKYEETEIRRNEIEMEINNNLDILNNSRKYIKTILELEFYKVMEINNIDRNNESYNQIYKYIIKSNNFDLKYIYDKMNSIKKINDQGEYRYLNLLKNEYIKSNKKSKLFSKNEIIILIILICILSFFIYSLPSPVTPVIPPILY